MKFRMRPLARLAPVFLAIATVWTQAQALDFGVNINLDNTTADLNTQRAAVMKPRNIKTARIGIVDSWNDTTARRDQAVKIVANGGTVQAGIFPSFTWDHSCNQDFASVEQKAYNETATAVNKVKDVIHDFELMNENQYRQEIASEVAPNSAGTQTAPYQGKPCIASLTAALRGMSRAIKDIRASSGLPLRVILGQAGRDWGFLTFMQQKGVQFDVLGWHVYQHYANESLLTDSWWGPGGPYAQMAAFGKPVTVNEFNCGETYLATYENLAGQPVTETCLKSIDKHLTDLINQTSVKIESVYAYEIVDEPQKAGPEDRFGLTYDLTRPKVHMYLYTAFAGGTLTAAERYEITSRGLMTDAEIDSRQVQVAPAAESPKGSSITTTGTLVDSTGASWTVSGGVIYRNRVATVSSSVVLLLYWNHIIYQQNSYGGWWAWVNGGWQATTDPRLASAPAPAPALPTAPAPASDTQAPVVVITSPSDGAVFGRRSTISVGASASDNVAVTEVRFYMNGSLKCVANASPFQCQMQLPVNKSAGGGTTIKAQASDAAGNVGRQAIHVYTQ